MNDSTKMYSTNRSICLSAPAPSERPAPSFVTAQDGCIYRPAERIGRGGEGSVYLVQEHPELVLKLYHRPAPHIEAKLSALIGMQLPCRVEGRFLAAVPQQIVRDTDGRVSGFLMPRLGECKPLYEVRRMLYHEASPAASRSPFLRAANWRTAIAIAYNLCFAVDCFHRRGLVLGDLNDWNISVQADNTVVFFDLDSADVIDRSTGAHFPCAVGVADFIAPELQNSLHTAPMNQSTDLFALAVLVFMMLFKGYHPFQFRTLRRDLKSEDIPPPNRAIAEGICPFVRDVPGYTLPQNAPSLELVPVWMQQMFRRVFDYTAETLHESIAQRPSAGEWACALQKLADSGLRICPRNQKHVYSPHLHTCPWCACAPLPAASGTRTRQLHLTACICPQCGRMMQGMFCPYCGNFLPRQSTGFSFRP